MPYHIAQFITYFCSRNNEFNGLFQKLLKWKLFVDFEELILNM